MLQVLFEFEKRIQLLDFKYCFRNEIIWPYIRCMIASKIIEEKSDGKSDIYNVDKGKFLKRNILRNPFLERNKKIVFFCSDISNNKNEDGKNVNYLYDYYCKLFEKDTLMIEYPSKRERPESRYIQNIKYQDFIDELVEAELKSTLKKYSDKDKKTVKEFVEYLKNELNYKFENGFYIGLENQLLQLSIKIKYYYKIYEKLLMQLKPKIIFMEQGCYGGIPRSCIMKIANSLNIVTAEFQHGMIFENHQAYTLPNYFKNNKDIKIYYPQYLLTMGQYWERNINVPCIIKVMGNPNLYKKIESYCVKENTNTILFICSVYTWKRYIKLIDEFCKVDKEQKYRIILRLHPQDRANIHRYTELLKYKNVTISDQGDVYECIKESDYIVGSDSTVIYESMAFNKNILIYRNELSNKYIKENIGVWFNNLEEFLCALKTKKSRNYDANIFWNRDWKENYTMFIKSIIN